MFAIDTSDKYDEQHRDLKKSAPALYVKLQKLIADISLHPTSGIGKPERLRGYGSREIYSRRIDNKNRLVYEMFFDENIVVLLRCKGHYDN